MFTITDLQFSSYLAEYIWVASTFSLRSQEQKEKIETVRRSWEMKAIFDLLVQYSDLTITGPECGQRI